MKTMLFGIAVILFAFCYKFFCGELLTTFQETVAWSGLFFGMLLVILGDLEKDKKE